MPVAGRSRLIGLLALVLLPAGARAQRLQLDVSLKELQRRVAADSNDAVAHYNVALGYWSKSKWDEAGAELVQATRLDPRFAPAHLALAYLPFARRPGLMEEALEGDTPLAWVDSVRAADRQYRLAFILDPLVDLRITATVVPRKSALWEASDDLSQAYDFWLRGFDEFRMGHYDAAYFRLGRVVDAFAGQKSHSLEQVPGGILWYRALAAAHLQRWPEAISDVVVLLDRAAKETAPDSLVYRPLDDNNYRFLLAKLYESSGQLDRATELYRRSAERDLGLYTAHVELANMLERQGRLAEALEERQRAINAAPDDPTLLFDLAITDVKAAHYAEAERALEQETKALPRDSRAWYVLGQVRLKLGDREQGRADLERFLALAPSRFASQIAQARRTLGQER